MQRAHLADTALPDVYLHLLSSDLQLLVHWRAETSVGSKINLTSIRVRAV